MSNIIANPKGQHPTHSETIEVVMDWGEYGSDIYILEFIRAFRWRNIKNYGSVDSILTQCAIRHNGFIIANAHCYKDSRDKEDNKFHAYKIALSKALAQCNIGDKTKKVFWEKILAMKQKSYQFV